MDKPKDWDTVWMDMAFEIAKRSKDPSTKVGCLLVSPDNRSIFVGYNGFPEGFLETPELWCQKPQENNEWCKYDLVVHAESNALDHKKCDVRGWRCYTTCYPCSDCALRLVNNKIAKIFYVGKSKGGKSKYELSKFIFEGGKVEVVELRKESINDKQLGKNRR